MLVKEDEHIKITYILLLAGSRREAFIHQNRFLLFHIVKTAFDLGLNNHVNCFQASIMPSICKKIGNKLLDMFGKKLCVLTSNYIVQCNVHQSNVLPNLILSNIVQNFKSC